ncbi:hypothetical protein FRC17_009237 [Serendipita sp. 399]|nr:hypothetical protein FRC17_009237 [Serendipita sp. 399]
MEEVSRPGSYMSFVNSLNRAEDEDARANDSDEEMFSIAPEADSSHLGVPAANKSLDTLQRTMDTSLKDYESSDDEGQTQGARTLDLLDQIHNMYRLLDLISDQGTGGAVDKVIIAQDSLSKFANRIHPGSYVSMTKVNFHALDKHRIRPRGIYGSIDAIADFLLSLGCIDAETRELLVQPRDEHSGISRPTLRPGIYAINASTIVEPDLFYIIFWPEDDTWVDGVVSAASRNRVTFMRYLTKLCDQIVCLISDEHSKNLEWRDDAAITLPADDVEMESHDLYDRLFSFSVKQTTDQEETATVKEGFTLEHSLLRDYEQPPIGYPSDFPLGALQPQLVVGEMSQALMSVDYIPEELVEDKIKWPYRRTVMEEKLREESAPVIKLHDKISKDSLDILLELKLGLRCGKAEIVYRQTLEDDNRVRESYKAERLTSERTKMSHTLGRLAQCLPFWLVQKTVEHYASLSQEVLMIALLGDRVATLSEADVTNSIKYVELFLTENPILRNRILAPFKRDLANLETYYNSRFNVLKRQFCLVYRAIQNDPNLTNEQIQSLVDMITWKHNFDSEFAKRTPGMPARLLRSFSSVVKWPWASGGEAGTSTTPPPSLDLTDDIKFVQTMDDISSRSPVYTFANDEIRQEVIKSLKRKLDRIIKDTIEAFRMTMGHQIDVAIGKDLALRKKAEDQAAWDTLKKHMCLALSSNPSNSQKCLLIKSVTREGPSRWSLENTDRFVLSGTWTQPNTSGFHYTLHQLEIRSDDMQKVTTNHSHVCNPLVRSIPSTSFTLPLPSSLRFIRLIGKDNCLAVVEHEDALSIYFDTVDMIGASIESEKHKKRFTFERIGRNHHYALDESKHLFALVATHPHAINIHVYTYEQDTRSFNARGGATNIIKWYPQGLPTFAFVTFVPGTEELLLVDQKGHCRLFYLITETFRPSALQLGSSPLAAFPTSDGACLLVFDEDQHKLLRLRAFHWASFGSTSGIQLPLPSYVTSKTSLAVTSLGHPSANHVLFLRPSTNSCSSIALRITRMSTEFEFTSHDNRSEGAYRPISINNALIDCHSEVWTRFPIIPSIVRQPTINAQRETPSILFVSTEPSLAFKRYFATMVDEFEHKTRKTTGGMLSRIMVEADVDWDPLHSTDSISNFEAAITRSNRFIPLKDGVISPAFEQSLLGANVSEISEAITFGWYESIFNSYLAAKPVKVVTSMGEQSVGKSYALNHFMDTSFAGSAMRCTEGVWLSVTPTRDTLFAFTQSKEVPKKVLFRNNFALSRDIAELFTSFQSCTTILDPTSNPNLFQSLLIIVVKDVIKSDSKEIKNEFMQKFARIVQQERGQNFISKLHRGQLDIVPWPVIESSEFYVLFDILRDRLIKRPTTHKHAVMFVDILKTLMAKLKANDWGALDQNLALQRAEYLSSMLATALAFGTCDPNTREPLKNCDTDESLEDGQTDYEFYVSSALDPKTDEPLIPELCLHELRVTWEKRRHRFDMDDQIFLQEYNAYLQGLADQRISYVRQWLTQNTLRFGEKSEITAVMRRFDGLAKEMKAAVVLCGISCAKCGLLCIEQKYHAGRHDCNTTHLCHRICAFANQHDAELPIPPCDMPYVHV